MDATNPAVAAILAEHSPPSLPAAAGRPVKIAGLSMSKEAIRSRGRRAAARQAPPVAAAPPVAPVVQVDPPAAPPAGDKFTPSHLQLMPAGPAQPADPTPDQMQRAVRNWSMIVRACGFVASKIFKGDELKVPDDDARDCAEAILDGWPELANASDADFKKIMACVTVGSVGFQRWELHQNAKQTRSPAPSPATPADATPTRSTPDGKSLTLLSL